MSRHLLPATLATNDEVSSRLIALAEVYSALKPDEEWKGIADEEKRARETRLQVINHINHLLGDTQ